LEHDELVRELVAVRIAQERVQATVDRAEGQRLDFSVERAIREDEVGRLDESHSNRRRSSSSGSSGDKLDKEMEEMQRVIDELQDYSELDGVEKCI
jgi:hypothetical protein